MEINRRQTLALAGAAAAVGAASSHVANASEEASPMQKIRSLDYTVIFARDPKKMRDFYEKVMKFPINKVLGENWVEFQVGQNTLVLSPVPAGGLYKEEITKEGVASLQLAFRVPPAHVDLCAEALKKANVPIIGEPTNQPWGHRTLFFRDPDNNILEIYADI